MGLSEAFSTVPAALPGSFDQLAQHLPEEWVAEALEATGTATIRKRRLPAEQVLWLVLGMALMRNQSVQRLAALLDIALPSKTGRLAVPSALVQARQRLGAAPIEYLFGLTGARWAGRSADADRWKGLGVYAMDGTTVRVPDSPENWVTFGGQVGNGTRAGSAYPTARVVALMAVRSHVLAAMRVGKLQHGRGDLGARAVGRRPSRLAHHRRQELPDSRGAQSARRGWHEPALAHAREVEDEAPYP